jgi:hypothetical protein
MENIGNYLLWIPIWQSGKPWFLPVKTLKIEGGKPLDHPGEMRFAATSVDIAGNQNRRNRITQKAQNPILFPRGKKWGLLLHVPHPQWEIRGSEDNEFGLESEFTGANFSESKGFLFLPRRFVKVFTLGLLPRDPGEDHFHLPPALRRGSVAVLGMPAEFPFPLFPILAQIEIIRRKCGCEEFEDREWYITGVHLFENLTDGLFRRGLEYLYQWNLVLLEALDDILNEVVPDLKTIRDLFGGTWRNFICQVVRPTVSNTRGSGNIWRTHSSSTVE